MKIKQDKSINESEFFSRLAKYSNYIPENTVRDVYYALLKVIAEQFREGREIILPNLGKFYVFTKPPQKHYSFKTRGVTEVIGVSKQVDFQVSQSLKGYINSTVLKDSRD